MKWYELCGYMKPSHEYLVEELAKFHGHLGPFIAFGYRTGCFSLKYFDNNQFSLFSTVHCLDQPHPEFCPIDGVQIGSNCTRGKRNIEYARQRVVQRRGTFE